MPYLPGYAAYQQRLPLTPPEDDNMYYGAMPNTGFGGGYQTTDARYTVDDLDKYAYVKQKPAPLPSLDYQQTVWGKAPWEVQQQSKQYQNHMLPTYSRSPYRLTDRPILPVPGTKDTLNGAMRAMDINHAAVRGHVVSKPVEEKITGGVAAKLDYELEQMIDFVTEMARNVLRCTTESHHDFRRYISSLLSSTRLPSTTILLALHYLDSRVKLLSSQDVDMSGSRVLYKMTTTALMIASKFLDDNTFQNKSWAEVSRTHVNEINTLEMEWLVDMGWQLHVSIEKNEGFPRWMEHWKLYQAKLNRPALSVKPVPAPGLPIPETWNYNPPTPQYSPNQWYQNWRSQNGQVQPLNVPSYWTKESSSFYNVLDASHPRLPPPPPLILPPLQQSPSYTPYMESYGALDWQNHAHSSCNCHACVERYNMYSYGVQIAQQ